MSSHVYHEIYLHFNWHTKADLPLLTGDLEQFAHRELQEKCRRIKGAYLHGIGGTDTHVHLALSIEPFVTISDLVQELKGASSFEVNRRMNRKALEWQRGYGVVSFGKAESRLGTRLRPTPARAPCRRSASVPLGSPRCGR